MKDIFIVVPTLNPSEKLLDNFLRELQEKFANVLLFDDGCRDEYDDYFKKKEKQGIIVLHHYKNLGKGRALKDAYNYILENYPDIKGVVTADSDGQHSVKDITKVAKEVVKHPNDLILGCRDFDDPSVPKKNKFGNKTTRMVFKLFVGLNITDTQTGLRGLGRSVMEKSLDIAGERFEFENNQLIETIDRNIRIREVTIKTIYEDKENYETHFNPIKDSIAIYKTFIKYIGASLSAALVDLVMFMLFNSFIKTILICTIIARVISSTVNYFINSKAVFKNSTKLSIIKYYLLVVIQMFMSGILTTLFKKLIPIPTIIIKMVVDTCIFIVNYYILKKYIFGGKNEKE